MHDSVHQHFILKPSETSVAKGFMRVSACMFWLYLKGQLNISNAKADLSLVLSGVLEHASTLQ